MTKVHANVGNKNAEKKEEEKATTQFTCRVNPSTKARWREAAQKENKKLTPWIVETLNAASSK